MSKKFRSSIIIIAPIIILFVLVFTYRDALRSMVLIPLAYLIFIFRLVFVGIGQKTLWVSFVVISTIIAALSLMLKREEKPIKAPGERKYPTRLQTWISTVNRKERSPYFKWNMAQDLSNLFIQAIAYRDGNSLEQVRQQVEAGKIELPPDILTYLQISQKPFARTGMLNHHLPLMERIWKTISTPKLLKKSNSPLDIDPEKLVVYLEEFLNIDDDMWIG